MKQEYITIISKRVKKKIRTADILYIIKSEYLSLIHLIDGGDSTDHNTYL